MSDTEIEERLEKIGNSIRILYGRIKEEHDWTMHMVLALRKDLAELKPGSEGEGVADGRGDR